jgi:glycosyltransferase involved in cell wall biosynthesis
MKNYNIGIFHYIANLTDGVSLEMNKWKRVFQEMGHTVHLCAGYFGSAEEHLIEEMYHHRPDARLLNQNTFRSLQDYPNEEVYRTELYRLADIIEEKMGAFIKEEKINFLVPQNVWSVAANPSVAIALTRVMRNYKIPALAHNHDFYFERRDGFSLTCAAAAELADRYLPPRDPLAKHVVINSLAQRQLLERKGLNSVVVPNTFDFDSPPWEQDEYNQDFRERIGLRPNDILILQATRIVTRKGIELALDFVRALDSPERRNLLKNRGLHDGRSFGDDDRIVFVLAGYALDDVTGRYKSVLAHKAEQMGVEALFIADLVGERRSTRKGEKIYSLWDTYVFADFITYPSLWEGWGNQLLEALRARLPVMLFEYPVYKADIKDKGLKVVSLGDEITGHDEHGLVTISPEIIQRAADFAIELLTNAELFQATVQHNYRVGKKHYSMDALYIYLDQLMHSYQE